VVAGQKAKSPTSLDVGLGGCHTISVARGWRTLAGVGKANVITAPVASACKTEDNDLLPSFTYSAEMSCVARGEKSSNNVVTSIARLVLTVF